MRISENDTVLLNELKVNPPGPEDAPYEFVELFGAPNADAPGVSDVSLGETWYLGLLAGALLWVGLFPGGPKIPGTEVPLFDPGLINQMSAGISDIASPYVLPTPAAPATQ